MNQKKATNQNWGHCQHCKHFASPARAPLPAEEARCLQPELGKYELIVFGASGCRAFELRPGFQASIEEPPEHIAATP